jgi:transposase
VTAGGWPGCTGLCELVAIPIPSPTEEAVRDLCRTRADMVQDRMRARHRLSKLLLRHGQVWRDGKAWTLAHERWLCTQHFAEESLQTTDDHYRAVLQSRDAQLEAIEADLTVWQDRAPFAAQVARLAAYRGVTRLGALHLAAEVADWRRFARASQFMGFCGLVPSEYSSGQTTRRGHITKAGNRHLRTQLVDRLGLPAPAQRRRPAGEPPKGPRPPGGGPSMAAQLRLCGRSDASGPTSPPPTSSPPPSPGSSPGSYGPR